MVTTSHSTHQLRTGKTQLLQPAHEYIEEFWFARLFLTNWEDWKSVEKTEFEPSYSLSNTQTYVWAYIDIYTIPTSIRWLSKTLPVFCSLLC